MRRRRIRVGMSIRLGSLFSGYGGLDLAVEMALGPTDPAFVSDIEPGPCAVLAHRFPDAPNLGDITKVDVSALPDVDAVAGGSPCQDMSLAGKRAGMREGTRSGLWSFQCDIIAAKRPKLVVWENVAGALSARAASRRDVEDADRLAVERREKGLCSCDEPDGADVCAVCGLPVGERAEPPANMRGLGRVLADLSNLGYDAAWRLLEAADVGAPHHRARVFVTAWPHDADAFLPADPYATFDPGMDVWLTDQPDLFGTATVFRDVWPKSGIMVSASVGPVPGGWLDAIPPRGGLLSTPNTMDMLPPHGHLEELRVSGRGGYSNLRDEIALLYTPKASDAVFGSPATAGRPLDKCGFLSTQVRLLNLPGRMTDEEIGRREGLR